MTLACEGLFAHNSASFVASTAVPAINACNCSSGVGGGVGVGDIEEDEGVALLLGSGGVAVGTDGFTMRG